MALINCEECGKEISDKASACPHCGVPLERKIESEKSSQNAIKEEAPSADLIGSMIGWVIYAKPLSDTWSIVIGWVFGLLLLIKGLSSFGGNSLVSPILILIASFVLLPPIRMKLHQKTNKTMVSGFRILIVLSLLFYSFILVESADKTAAQEEKQKVEAEQNAKEVAQREKEIKEFRNNKDKILQLVADNIKTKSFNDALQTCNTYMKFEDKDLTPLCTTVKTEILKIEQKEQEERAKKEAAEAAKAKAREEAELKASMGPRAWKLHKKHPDWSIDDCKNVARGRYWIGMSTEMLVASFGRRPDSANPSNFGSGTNWQYCWHNYTPACFYDHNDDGIIDSYN